MDLEAMDMDRISDLPQPILYHILSSLPQKEAVKTCVLSKLWLYLWYGRPNLEFCKNHFKGSTEEFISALDHTLIRYNKQNLSIQKLILKMPVKKFDSVSVMFLEKWIPNKVLLGVETFHLSSHCIKNAYFDMPWVLFESESLRKLYLKRCKLNQIINFVLFKHLQTLSLTQVHIKEETFERIMLGCPLIQDLSLDKCKGLKTVKLINRNCSLRNFEFQGFCLMNVRIEIANGSSIETINLTGSQGYWFDHNRNNLFARLKSLFLSYLHLTTKSLDILSCNFPCLEELELSVCYGFKEFQISSCSIKRLAIEVGEHIKVSVDAPNISKFEYKGDYIPSHITFTITSNKWKENIVLFTKLNMNIPLWLDELDELLMALSRCDQTSLSIRVFRYEDDIQFFPSVILNIKFMKY